MSNTGEQHGHEPYFFFVDDQRYESTSPTVTGAIIRSMLPNLDRSYALFAESHGNDPDVQVNDDTSIDLRQRPPVRIYSVPPASFGGDA